MNFQAFIAYVWSVTVISVDLKTSLHYIQDSLEQINCPTHTSNNRIKHLTNLVSLSRNGFCMHKHLKNVLL